MNDGVDLNVLHDHQNLAVLLRFFKFIFLVHNPLGLVLGPWINVITI